MIAIDRFTSKYTSDIASWLVKRDLPTHVVQDLPHNGVVALLKGTPIAAGFLRLCEGGYGMLDSFITDPDAPPEYRAQALDILIDHLIEFAKCLELKQILSTTGDKNTLMRAQRHGMIATSHTVLVHPLNPKGE